MGRSYSISHNASYSVFKLPSLVVDINSVGEYTSKNKNSAVNKLLLSKISRLVSRQPALRLIEWQMTIVIDGAEHN